MDIYVCVCLNVDACMWAVDCNPSIILHANKVDKATPAPIVTPTDKPSKPPKPTAAKSSAAPKRKQPPTVVKHAALAVAGAASDDDDERRTHRYSPGPRTSAASSDDLSDARELQIRSLMKVSCIACIKWLIICLANVCSLTLVVYLCMC